MVVAEYQLLGGDRWYGSRYLFSALRLLSTSSSHHDFFPTLSKNGDNPTVTEHLVKPGEEGIPGRHLLH